MAKLKAIYDTEDEIPEPAREFYTERNGKFELQAEGVKTEADVARVQTALNKEKLEHKETKNKLIAFGDLDPAVIPGQLEELATVKTQLDAAIKDGKIDPEKQAAAQDAAIKRALGPVEREKTQLQRDLDAARKTAAEKDAEVNALNTSIKRGKIEGALRDAAGAAKIIPYAVNDALRAGVDVFEIAEDGRILTKDNVTGVTPGIEPKDWFKDQQEVAPHWWPASQGGGAGGSRGGLGSKADNPWTAENWNLTKQGAFVRQHGEAKAVEAAKAAGVTLGATRPAAKAA